MNWKSRPFAGVAITVLGLTSCNSMHKSDRTLIRNPTVAEMEQFEAKMGIQPKPATPSAAPINPTAGVYVPESTPPPAPTIIAPPPTAPTAPIAPTETLLPLAPAPAIAPTIPPLLR